MSIGGAAVTAEGVVLPFAVWRAGTALDLALERGGRLAVLGRSGSAKTLLLRCLGGVIPVAGGSLRVLERDPREAAPHVQYCGAFARVLPASARKRIAAGLAAARVPSSQRPARIAEALDALGLVDVRDVPGTALAGCQAAAVELACALALRPRLLLLDDLRSHLDASLQMRLDDYLAERRWDGGLTVVEATRHASVAATADRVLLLGAGGPLACGAPVDLLARTPGQIVTIECDQPRALKRTLTGIYDVQVLERDGRLRFSAPDGIAVAAQAFRHPVGGLRVVHVREPDLWDVVASLEAGADRPVTCA